MFRSGPILSPDGAATVATVVLLALVAGAAFVVSPAAAVAWLGSTAVMTWGAQ